MHCLSLLLLYSFCETLVEGFGFGGFQLWKLGKEGVGWDGMLVLNSMLAPVEKEGLEIFFPRMGKL